MTSENGETIPAMGAIPLRRHQRVLWPGLILLAVGVALYVVQLSIDWEVIRGEWNERGLLVYRAERAWVPFVWLGGAMVLVNRLYAWPALRVIAGYALVLGLLIAHVVWPLIFPYSHERMSDRTASGINCMDHQRQIVLTLQMVTMDHGEVFPRTMTGLDLAPKTFKCHGEGTPGARWGGYGFNAHIAGRPVADFDPPYTIVTADGVTPMGLLSTPADIAKRHHGRYVASFADGHVEALEKDVPLAVKRGAVRE